MHCATGFGGQEICIDPHTESIVAQQRDPDFDNDFGIFHNGNFQVTVVATNASLPFEAVSTAPTKGVSEVKQTILVCMVPLGTQQQRSMLL